MRVPAACAIGSLWNKLLFATHFRNYQMLLSDDITQRKPV